MESSPEADVRRKELEREAPIRPKGIWSRTNFEGKDVCFLCGTIGSEFDIWQRRLSVTSAADALFAQQIGLVAVECVMDEMETELRTQIEAGGYCLQPRWSPGYGDHPLSISREIIRRLDATKRIGVSITDLDLLVPSKSVTAVCEIRER